MSKLRGSRAAWLLALLVVALLSGCSVNGVQSAFDPQAPRADAQMDLFYYTGWLSIIVVLGVGGALAYAIIRFREKPGDDSLPAQTHGNAAIEISLIVAAAVIAVLVAVPTIRVNFAMDSRLQDEVLTEDDVVINIIGWQWWWAYEYPDEGIVTANELHVPQGKRVVLNLTSGDVLHSFWVPKLFGKRDLIPNQNNQIWFTTTEDTPTGVENAYYGECAELCLGAHAYMRMRVIVDTPEDYEAWVAGFQDIEPIGSLTPQAEAPDQPVQIQETDPLITQGEQLFKTKGCAACHAVRGYAGGAVDKPDLTNFGLRTSLAAGVLDNTPENLARWLRDPQEVKPGNYMPTLWSEEDPNREPEIEALVAYLLSLGTEQAPQAQTSETQLSALPVSDAPIELPGGTHGN